MAKPKNLNEFLERQNPEDLLYIGTEEGGGWLIIDTVKNVLGLLDKVDLKLRKYCEDVIANYQRDLDRLPEDIVDTQKELAWAEEKGDIELLALNRRKLAKKEANYVSAYAGRKKYQSSLNTWKSFGERKLLDIYPNTSDKPGTCVLISGFEKGDYWFKEEYDKDVNGKIK